MSLSSRFESIEMAQHLCGKLLEPYDLPEETRHWILMALREALANAIKHGNSQDVAKRGHLDMDVVDDDLRLTIRDEGSGFDPNGLAAPLTPSNPIKTSPHRTFYFNQYILQH